MKLKIVYLTAAGLLLGVRLQGGITVDAAPRRKNVAWVAVRPGSKALGSWAQCKALSDLPGITAGDADLGEDRPVQVRRRRDGIDVYATQYGSGRWAYGVVTVFRLQHHSCAARGFTIEGGAESLIGGLRHFSVGDARASTIHGVPWVPEPLVVKSPDTRALAAARILVQLARDDQGEPDISAIPARDLLGPTWPTQPEHPGRPRGSPAARWSPAALRAARVQHPWLKDEEGERFDALYTWRVRDPVPLLRRGRWQLWELRFRYRLGGGLLAAYDRRSRRHRWVFATAYDNATAGHDTLTKSHFDVLLLKGDLLLLRTIFDDRQFLWAIDLARGVTRQVAVGGAVTLKHVAKGVQVKHAEGRVQLIPLSKLRP